MFYTLKHLAELQTQILTKLKTHAFPNTPLLLWYVFNKPVVQIKLIKHFNWFSLHCHKKSLCYPSLGVEKTSSTCSRNYLQTQRWDLWSCCESPTCSQEDKKCCTGLTSDHLLLFLLALIWAFAMHLHIQKHLQALILSWNCKTGPKLTRWMKGWTSLIMGNAKSSIEAFLMHTPLANDHLPFLASICK